MRAHPNAIPGLDIDDFVKNYWQKKSLVLPESFPEYIDQISREELLACTEKHEIESRLVLESAGEYPWQVEHGPFTRDVFRNLPDSNWTVLVQNMEMFHPAFFDLLQRFHFLPRWRFDDVMLSFSSKHGSVGPHLDSYDVFLLQLVGGRHWYINDSDYTEEDFIDGLDLRIIQNFSHTDEIILRPGDMLYLPPGIAHHGVGDEDSITCSIGFRSPSRQDLLEACLESAGSVAHTLYSDRDLKIKEDSYHFDSVDSDNLADFMSDMFRDTGQVATRLGCYFTTLPELIETTDSEVRFEGSLEKLISDQEHTLYRNLKTRALYSQMNTGIRLFVNGLEYELSQQLENFALQFCHSRNLQIQELVTGDNNRELVQILTEFVEQGFLLKNEPQFT